MKDWRCRENKVCLVVDVVSGASNYVFSYVCASDAL